MTIETILSQIELGNYALPEFQRGYVWNRDQVRKLMNSLYRGYPIGGLLTWVTPVDTSIMRNGSSGQAYGNVDLILDGQQRCNAITLGFREFNGDDKNPILWIDLLPSVEIQKRSNRRFFFYVNPHHRRV